MKPIFAAGFLLFTSPVLAQAPDCVPTEIVIPYIMELGQPVFSGLTVNGILATVYAFEDGSWLMVFSGPEGITCRITEGSYWTANKFKDGDPA